MQKVFLARPYLAWLAGLIGGGMLLLAALFIFRQSLLDPWVKQLLINEIRDQLGLEVAIDKVGGSYLTGLELAGIKTVGGLAKTPLEGLDIDRLELRYFLPALLAGADAFVGRMRIELEAAQMRLNLEREEEGPTAPPAEAGPAGLPLPSRLPEIKVAGSDLQLRTGGGLVTLSGLALTAAAATSRDSGQAVVIDIAQAVLPWAGFSHDPHRVALRLRYTPPAIGVDDFSIDDQALSHSMLFQAREPADGRVSFTGEADLELFAGRSHLETSFDHGRISAKLALELRDLGAFPAFLQPLPKGAAGRASGQVEINLDPDHPAGLTGTVELRLEDARLGEVAIRQAGLKAGAGDSRLRVRHLMFDSADGSLAIDDAELDLAAMMGSDIPAMMGGASGSFSLDLADAAPILALAGLPVPPADQAPAPLMVHGSGGLAQGLLTVKALEAELGDNKAHVENLAMPLAAAIASSDYYLLLAQTTGSFGVDAKELPRLFALAGQPLPSALKETGASAHRLALAGQMQAGRIDIAQGELHAGGADIILNQGQFTLPAPDFSLEKTTVRADLAAAVPDLAVLSALFSLPISARGSLNAKLQLSGSLAAVDGALELNARQLVLGRVRLDVLTARARARQGLISVDALEAQAGADRLQGRGSFEIASRRFADLNLRLSIRDLEVYLGETVAEDLRFAGRLQAEVTASGPWAEPEGRLALNLADGRYRSLAIREAALRLSNSGRRLVIEQARFDTAEGRLALAGELLRDAADQLFTINLASASGQRDGLELALTAPASLMLDRAGNLTTDRLLLAGSAGGIEASGRLQPAGNSDFTLRCRGLTSRGWLEGLIGDRLNFQGADGLITITGPLRGPTIAAAGTVAEISGRDAPFPFSGAFDLTLADQGIVLRQFSFSGKGSKSTIEARGRLPLDPFTGTPHPEGELELTAGLDLPDLGLIASMLPQAWAPGSGSLHGALLLQGTMNNPRGSLSLSGSRISLPSTVKMLPPEPLELNCELTAAAEKLSFAKLQVSSQALNLEGSGSWLAPPPLSQLLAGGPSLTGTLDLNARLKLSDLSWLARDSTAIRRLGGALELAATLTGAAAHPRINGSLRVADGELRPGADIPSLRAVNLDATLDASTITIKSLHGELGGAPVAVTGAVRDFTGAVPEFNLALSGENLLLYRDEGLKFRSDAQLTLKGPLPHLLLSGELAVTDGRFSRPFEFLSLLRGQAKPRSTATGLRLFSIHEAPFNRMEFKVRIITKDPFRIKNNLADGSLRPDVLLAGTGEVPVLTGKIYLDPSRIKLPSGIFTFDSGLLRFSETEPNQPQLDMTGKARLMGYDVTILTRGSLDEPVITLSSSPPLADDQLLLLVLTGKAPETGTTSAGAGGGVMRQGGMNVAVYLGRSVVDKWFSGSPESEESILDRFEFEIGRGVTKLGEETIEAQFRLARGVFRDDDMLFITAEKDTYDAFNSGVKLVFQFK